MNFVGSFKLGKNIIWKYQYYSGIVDTHNFKITIMLAKTKMIFDAISPSIGSHHSSQGGSGASPMHIAQSPEKAMDGAEVRAELRGCTYLEDSSVTIRGVKIYGEFSAVLVFGCYKYENLFSPLGPLHVPGPGPGFG